jgi:hypothetical protein
MDIAGVLARLELGPEDVIVTVRDQDTREVFGTFNIGPCWLWTGGLQGRNFKGQGYGSVWMTFPSPCPRCHSSGRMRRVHRVVYEELIGPIPPEVVPDHLCRVRRCANPFHLELVSQRENILRRDDPLRARTHCPKGHPYDAANTKWQPHAANGGRLMRHCRACKREWNRWNRAGGVLSGATLTWKEWPADTGPDRKGTKPQLPPCDCGRPHYAKGLCSRCYGREFYAKTQGRKRAT